MTSKESLHIDPYERTWIIISVILLIVFFGAVTVAGMAMGIRVPGPVARVNPNTVAQEGPFADPGLRELAPGKYEAYVLAQTWQFQPRDVTVPAGSTVTFFVTSKDVQHGFKIQDTNANMMVIPGQVTSLTVHFKNPGEYNFICTEYCGLGHGAMFGTVTVTP